MKLGQVIATAHEENNLYILDASPFTPECAYIVMTNNINTLIKCTDISTHALIVSTSSATSTAVI